MPEPQLPDAALLDEYMRGLVDKKKAEGKDADRAWQEAKVEYEAELRRRRGILTAEEYQQGLDAKVEEKKRAGKSEKEARREAEKEWHDEVAARKKKTPDQVQKEFYAELAKAHEDARKAKDKSLSDVGSFAGHQAWDAGRALVKDWYKSGDFLGSLRRATVEVINETAKEGAKQTFSSLFDRSLPELRDYTRHALGPNSEYEILQDWWGAEAYSTFGKTWLDFMERSDVDHVVMSGMTSKEVFGFNVFQAGKVDFPVIKKKEEDWWDAELTGNAHFRPDLLLTRGLDPSVLGKTKFGGKGSIQYKSTYLDLKAELEVTPTFNLDSTRFEDIPHRRFMEKYGGLESILKGTATVRPETNITLTLQTEFNARIDRTGENYDVKGELRLEFGFGGGPRPKLEELLKHEKSGPP